MLKTLWEFIKNPVYEEDTNTDINYRSSILIRFMAYALFLSLILLVLSAAIESLFNLEVGKHAMEDILNMSPWVLFLSAVIAAPVFEELIFRGPMVFFKESPYFKYMYYVLTIVFGYVHISNFEINTATLVLSPLLVAPQISIGFFLGYIRVRFGLLWSILFHSIYNGILTVPVVLAQLLDIPLK